MSSPAALPSHESPLPTVPASAGYEEEEDLSAAIPRRLMRGSPTPTRVCSSILTSPNHNSEGPLYVRRPKQDELSSSFAGRVEHTDSLNRRDHPGRSDRTQDMHSSHCGG